MTTEKKGMCLQCGKPLYGRTDKKFCDKDCKNDYHNSRTKLRNNIKNEVLNRLSINYDILTNLIERGLSSAEVEELKIAGFDPRVITGYRKGKYKHDEFACFDLRYNKSPNRIYDLHREEKGVVNIQ